MRRAMINCGQVQTQVMSEGRWIEEDPLPYSSKHVVLIMPGNPGIPQFYETFAKTLYSELSLETPVWIIGYAGHVQPPKDLDIAMPGMDKWDECYNLNAQVSHKAEFIKKYIPEDAKVHLIGHSIGSWCALNLLKDPDIEKRIQKCYLLFPTIEYMAESSNGRFFCNVVSRITSLLLFLTWICTTILPSRLLTLMIHIFGMFYGIPGKYDKIVQAMLDPRVLRKILNLAKEEMECVREADHETISKHIDKLWIYYGANDGWTPVKYYKNMIKRHPDLNAQLCQRGFQHSFVFKDDTDMGHIIGELVNEQLLTDTTHPHPK